MDSRPFSEQIDEVYPRMYMSGFGPADEEEVLNKHGITHIVSIIPCYTAPFPGKYEYLVFDNIQDNSEQEILPIFK